MASKCNRQYPSGAGPGGGGLFKYTISSKNHHSATNLRSLSKFITSVTVCEQVLQGYRINGLRNLDTGRVVQIEIKPKVLQHPMS